MKKYMEKAKRLLLVVTGGIGRNIFATGVIRNLKLAYPTKDIFVICGVPEIFQNNPNVKRIYSFDKPQHLFEDYVFENSDSLILDVEPYRHPDYLVGKKHVVECWCELLNIECVSIKPELFYVKNEKDVAKAFMSKYKKPVILLQHTGGKAPEEDNDKGRAIAKDAMYRRGLSETAVQTLVDQLIADGYAVGSIQHPNQFKPKGAEVLFFPSVRASLGLIPYASGIICNDSVVQHAAAAFDVPALVAWAGTNPEKLGYKIHKNLRRNVCSTPECHRPNTYVFDIQPSGMLWSCPFSEECCNYTGEELLLAFKELQGQKYFDDVETKKAEIIVDKQCKGECK